MVALFSLLIIITLSVIVVRIGAVALELTGLSSEIASFLIRQRHNPARRKYGMGCAQSKRES